MSDEVSPREILSFTPPGGEFRKAEYPWLVAVRVTARGGDGSNAADGSPGGKGETSIVLVPVADLEEVTTITVGSGGKGVGPKSPDGADGFVLLELFDENPSA
jgi:hypothetical protein